MTLDNKTRHIATGLQCAFTVDMKALLIVCIILSLVSSSIVKSYQEDSEEVEMTRLPVATIPSESDPVLSTHVEPRKCWMSELWLTSFFKFLSIISSLVTVGLALTDFDEVCKYILLTLSVPFGLGIPEILSSGFEPLIYRDKRRSGAVYWAMVGLSIGGTVLGAIKLAALMTFLRSYPDNSDTCDRGKLDEFPWLATIVAPSLLHLFSALVLLAFSAINRE